MAEPTEFRTPLSNRLLDMVLFALLLPVVLLAGLFLWLVVGWVGIGLAGIQPFLWEAVLAGGGATLLMLAALRTVPCVPWRLRIEVGDLVFSGLGRARRIPLSDIDLVTVQWSFPQSVDQADSQVAGLEDASGSVQPLFVHSGRRRTRILLGSADARNALDALLRRCPRAAGVDAAGRDILPEDPAAVPAARRRLAVRWTILGGAAMVIGVVGILAVAFTSGQAVESLDPVKNHAQAIVVGIGSVSLATWGAWALRKSRVLSRGLHRRAY